MGHSLREEIDGRNNMKQKWLLALMIASIVLVVLSGCLTRSLKPEGALWGEWGFTGSQALILAARGDLDEAMSLHKEQERICHQVEIPGADPVDFSVMAPQKVICAQMFLLQVFLHTPEEAETAQALAIEFDPTANRLGTSQLEVDLLPGSVIMVELFLPGMEIDEPVQRLIWKSRTTSIQFGVSVPSAAKPGPLLGRIRLHLDGIPVGSLRFKLYIVSEGIGTTPLTPQRLECEGQRFRQAFISYSLKDRKEVIKRVQMLERFHIHFFQDILNLEPGTRWEQELYKHIDTCDVFLLFWSSASKESPWVDKEVRYALARKENSGTDSPEIIPILIEGPPVPFPPEHLSHLHFNDRMLYFMQDS
jgi:hypothetical protein